MVFDREDPQGEVRYKCERCGEVLGEYQWKQAARRGRFVAENPGAEARGFHLNTLASTFCGWKEIVQKFLVAKEQLDQGNPEGMKVWVNTELGETWEEQGEVVEDAELLGRRELYEADVPDGVLVLTAGIDVQDDRFEVEVVGWGVGKERLGHSLPEDFRRPAEGARFGQTWTPFCWRASRRRTGRCCTY